MIKLSNKTHKNFHLCYKKIGYLMCIYAYNLHSYMLLYCLYIAILKGVSKFYIWAFISYHSYDGIRIYLLTYIAIHLLAN